jgi:hypothetical protein
MQFIKYIPIFLIFASCSEKNANNKELPIYSDMGAAEDAGKAK